MGNILDNSDLYKIAVSLILIGIVIGYILGKLF